MNVETILTNNIAPKGYIVREATKPILEKICDLDSAEVVAMLAPLSKDYLAAVNELNTRSSSPSWKYQTHEKLVTSHPHLCLALVIEKYPMILQAMLEEKKEELRILNSVNAIMKVALKTGASAHVPWKKQKESTDALSEKSIAP